MAVDAYARVPTASLPRCAVDVSRLAVVLSPGAVAVDERHGEVTENSQAYPERVRAGNSPGGVAASYLGAFVLCGAASAVRVNAGTFNS